MLRKYRTKNNPVYIQEDRASYYTTKIPTEYWLKIKVKSLDWPSQSPDLAPIENLQKIAKNRIAKKRYKIQGTNKIDIVVIEKITRFDSNLLERLARSFTTRIDLYIKVKSSSIKY